MFENIPVEEKLEICDEQLRQVHRQIFSQMIALGLDPLLVDPATITVDEDAENFQQTVQAEIVAAVARAAFINGIKSSLNG